MTDSKFVFEALFIQAPPGLHEQRGRSVIDEEFNELNVRSSRLETLYICNPSANPSVDAVLTELLEDTRTKCSA